MDPITAGALITGGTALVGGILGNQANASNTAAANAQSAANQASANKANLQSVREQMQFQERMSNSAYQRSMNDMRTAGLNPMLAFSQGGASSPAGAAATSGAAPVQKADYKDPFAPAMSSAVGTYQTMNQMKIAGSQLAINQANSTADIALKAAQVANTTQSAKNAAINAKILEAQAKKSKLEGDWYGSETGSTLYQLNKINETVGGVLDSTNSAVQLINPFSQLKNLKKQIKQKRGTGIMKDGTTFDLKTGEVLP